jgi:hypothetical protein
VHELRTPCAHRAHTWASRQIASSCCRSSPVGRHRVKLESWSLSRYACSQLCPYLRDRMIVCTSDI